MHNSQGLLNHFSIVTAQYSSHFIGAHYFWPALFQCWMFLVTTTIICNCLAVKINSHKLSTGKKCHPRIGSEKISFFTVYFKWWIASVWLTEFGSLNEFQLFRSNFFPKIHRRDKVVAIFFHRWLCKYRFDHYNSCFVWNIWKWGAS